MRNHERAPAARHRGRTGGVIVAACAASLVAGRAAAGTPANWLTASDGAWTDPTRWSSNPYFPANGAPGTGDTYDVTVDATGTPYAITLNSSGVPGGAITIDRLTLGTSAATVLASAGTFQASLGLTINDGTFRLAGATLRNTIVAGTGGTFDLRYGVLDGVTLRREARVQNNVPYLGGTTLLVRNGLTLDGGSLHLTFEDSPSLATAITFDGNQTLGGTGTVVLDGGRNPFIAVRGQLTVGAGVLVHGVAEVNYFSGEVVNYGVVRADVSGRAITFDPAGASQFINKGLLEATAGGTLALGALVDNTAGTIRANAGTVIIGDGRTAQLGYMEGVNGGAIVLGGTLDNAGATLTSSQRTGTLYLASVVSGGTLANTDGTEFAVTGEATVGDVTLSGQLSLRPPDASRASILHAHNLTLAGGTIGLYGIAAPGYYGNRALLYTNAGAETIDGTGRITFEGNGDVNEVRAYGGSLTLAPGITVSTGAGGGAIGRSDTTTINKGTILAQTPGRTITLNNVTNLGTIQVANGSAVSAYTFSNASSVTVDGGTLALAAGWDNSLGTIAVRNGSTLTLLAAASSTAGAGAFSVTDSTVNLSATVTSLQLGQLGLSNSSLVVSTSGVLNNGGTNAAGPLDLGAAKVTMAGGKIVGGTVRAALMQVPAGVSYLDGVTLGMPVQIADQAVLRASNSLGLSGASISMRGQNPVTSNTYLDLTNGTTLDGNGEIVFDGTGGNALPTGASLNIGPDVVIRTGSAGGVIGSTSTSMTNRGSISAATAGQRITVSDKSLTNTGVLEATGGGLLDVPNVGNSGTMRAAAGGVLTLSGSWYSSGPITVDGGSLVLGGTFGTGSLARLSRSGNSTLTLKTGTLVNAGSTLDLDALGPMLLSGSPTISGGTVQGTAGLSGTGVSLRLDGVNLKAPVAFSGGATLTMSGGWTNAASVTVTDSTLVLGGTFTRAGIGTIIRSGGIVNFTGTLDNTGSTLQLDDATGTWTVLNGTIVGGTVRTAGAARLYVPSGSAMTLQGVTLGSDLELQGSQLKIAGGLSLSGKQVYGNGRVTFSGNGTNAQTLSNGTVGFWDSTSNLIENTSGAPAILDPDVQVRGEYLTIRGGTQGIVNRGSIRSLAPGGTLFMSGVTNRGRIDVEAGGTMISATSPSNVARVLFNSALVQFDGPRGQVYGAFDNDATGKVVVVAGADATFNGPVSGTNGTEVHVDAGGLATFRGSVTGPITFTGDGSINLEGGVSSIASLSAGNVVVRPQAVMQVGSVHANSLSVIGELSVRLNGTATGTSKVNRLAIDPEGYLNLGNNALIVDYDSNSGGSPLLDVQSDILGGQLAGGGTAAAAGAAVPGVGYGVGYAEAARILGPSGGSFMGQTVDASAVLVRYTLLGDSDLNGVVNFGDLLSLARNYGLGGGRVWAEGDYDYNGVVNFADLLILARNYGGSLPTEPVAGAPADFAQDLAAAAAAVPEPSSLLVACGAALTTLLTGRRRRRRRAQDSSLPSAQAATHGKGAYHV